MGLPHPLRHRHRTVMALLFQGIADRRCLARRTDRQAQRRHHHPPRLHPPERARQPKGNHRYPPHHRRLPPDVMEMTAASPPLSLSRLYSPYLGYPSYSPPPTISYSSLPLISLAPPFLKPAVISKSHINLIAKKLWCRLTCRCRSIFNISLISILLHCED